MCSVPSQEAVFPFPFARWAFLQSSPSRFDFQPSCTGEISLELAGAGEDEARNSVAIEILQILVLVIMQDGAKVTFYLKLTLSQKSIWTYG